MDNCESGASFRDPPRETRDPLLIEYGLSTVSQVVVDLVMRPSDKRVGSICFVLVIGLVVSSFRNSYSVSDDELPGRGNSLQIVIISHILSMGY